MITPGEWYAMTSETGGLKDQANVFSDHETDGEPTLIADTMGVDNEVPLEQRKANARAIAAIPRIIAELKAIIAECEHGSSQGLRSVIAEKAHRALSAANETKPR